MKLTIKIALVISLFCATAFAGEMGSGGFAGGDMGEGGFCGEMGSGGKCLVAGTTNTIDVTDQADSEDDILNFVRDFLAEIFG